jgi:hypothetical protein|tara:strand:- start:48 stop:434 length:387 start_codon:yes stop_codon:yes gene_type:complete
MITIRHKETILRNAMDVAYAIDIDVECYKLPLAEKDRFIRENFDDAEPTVNIKETDWDKSNKLSSERHQFLIPTNKQTDTFPSNKRESNTDYDSLIWEWRELYQEDSDIIRLTKEQLKLNEEHDGIQE